MLKTDGIDAPHRHQSYSIENRSLIVLCVLWLVIKNIMCIFFYLNVHEIKIQLNSLFLRCIFSRQDFNRTNLHTVDILTSVLHASMAQLASAFGC